MIKTPKVVVTCVLLACLSYSVNGQETQADTEHFLGELSFEVLKSKTPVKSSFGWTGVVLSPPGTSLSPAMGTSASLRAKTEYSQLLAESYLLDTALIVRHGYAFPKTRSLSDTWYEVLKKTMPPISGGPESLRDIDEDTARWLFRRPDRVDTAIGVVYGREPSYEFLKYREYELLHRLVAKASESNQQWRLHPRLYKYATLEEAKSGVLADWQTFGHRAHVETALRRFNESENAKRWLDWMAAYDAFNDNSSVEEINRVAISQLAPPPSDWLRLASWERAEVSTQNGGVISFQYARIRIVRRWFLVNLLADGRLILNSKMHLSDGELKSVVEYPAGDLAVIPEELLLVQRIQVDDKARETRHRLNQYVYPERIQLLGFVVRVLPPLSSTAN